MNTLPFFLTVIAIFASGRALAQGRFDEQPLRGNLAEVPFANTSLGREQYRFAGEEVNRYRIYDYYKRQARWHLEHPDDKEPLLLPFTGLDGGRRGHWGVTNEPSIQAFQRKEAPLLPEIVARGEYGLHYLTFPGSQGVVVYDVRIPGVKRVLAGARLVSPPGPFRGEVDIWGFSIRTEGTQWMALDAAEWSAQDHNVDFLGYHVSGGDIAYRHTVGTSEFLEQVALNGKGEEFTLVRRFAFSGPVPEFRFSPAGAQQHLPLAGGNHLFRSADGETNHLVSSGGGLVLDLDLDGKSLVLKATPRGSWLEVRTWRPLAGKDDIPRVQRITAPDPVATANGQIPRYSKQTIVVRGKPDADPAASGTAYEIDDIAIPFDNHWKMPMTLSGIDFDARGVAYVCTMVGDVWRVEGLDRQLAQVKWRRYASGLNRPLGLVVVDGVPYVSCRNQIIKLHDRNGDLEADYYEQFNKADLPLGADNGGDLRRDRDGNFYINGGRGVFRVSSDGTQVTQVGSGSRNPLGLGVREDGLVLSDSSEGESYNGTCTIFESGHPENSLSTCKKKRILYLPRGIDHSPGSRIFLNEPRFGPLGDSILGLSYGTGTWYRILRDENDGTPQAALHRLPGEFASGAMRIARNPADGQVYCVGLDGWGDYAVHEGCFHRLRYTGKKLLIPDSWQAHRNGLMIRFGEPVDPASLQSARFFAQQWNTVDYRMTYGSADFSVRSPDSIGHDRLTVTRVLPQPDGRSVFFEIPDLRPAMYTQLYGRVAARSGDELELDLYGTINRLREDFEGAAVSPVGKPDTLVVREEEQNGNTYDVVTGFFDKKAGRDTVKRPVDEPIPWTKEEIDYSWVKSRIIEPKCIMCHQAGTPHDLSTYDNLVRRLVPGNPTKSHIIGLLKTNTMPPYPLPALHPSSIEALEHWVKTGAPNEKNQ